MKWTDVEYPKGEWKVLISVYISSRLIRRYKLFFMIFHSPLKSQNQFISTNGLLIDYPCEIKSLSNVFSTIFFPFMQKKRIC